MLHLNLMTLSRYYEPFTSVRSRDTPNHGQPRPKRGQSPCCILR